MESPDLTFVYTSCLVTRKPQYLLDLKSNQQGEITFDSVNVKTFQVRAVGVVPCGEQPVAAPGFANCIGDSGSCWTGTETDHIAIACMTQAIFFASASVRSNGKPWMWIIKSALIGMGRMLLAIGPITAGPAILETSGIELSRAFLVMPKAGLFGINFLSRF